MIILSRWNIDKLIRRRRCELDAQIDFRDRLKSMKIARSRRHHSDAGAGGEAFLYASYMYHEQSF